MATVAAGPGDGLPAGERPAALAGVRVLEASVTRAGRIAGMLLADLGAQVVRADLATAGGPTAGGSTLAPSAYAGGSEPVLPEDLWWDRGKRIVRMGPADAARLAGGADVLLVDQTPARLAALGLTAAELASGYPRLCPVWLPPYGEHGEWAEVAEDPLLLAALGGVAARNPATWDCPVAPVTATTTHLHGALGAAAAIAALLGRRRDGGRGHGVTVSGLDAAAAQLGMMTQVGLDVPVVRGSKTTGKGVPYWRNYQTSDGRWLYLAALVPEIFIRALDAMDRMDVLVQPGVDGDWNRLQVWEQGGKLVVDELVAEFRRRPLAEWLELFAAHDVPCAPIARRAEWAGRDIVAANHAFVRREHPEVGPVTLPGFPVDLTRTPAVPGAFPVPEDLPAGGELWPDAQPGQDGPATDEAPSAGRLPLSGIRVVDLSSYLAGPLIGEILADWGADVVKVEPPDGDPFRVFPMSVLVASQHKRSVALDIGAPGGADVLLRLLRGADLFVENMRPGRMERAGLTPERVLAGNPGLVRCSVSAYGHAGEYADAPGFDPVFQALSGLADAQGGDDDPVLTPIPLNDTGTGVLGALSALAALYARGRDGAGDRLYLSLANTATFLQSPEFTDYAGRPPAPRGRADFPGPTAGHRYYQCADGWLAVAAITAAQVAGLVDAAGLPAGLPGGAEGGDDELAAALAAALAHRSVRDTAGALAARGIPAVPVTLEDEHVEAPHLVANRFTHVVADPRYGRFHIARGYGTWVQDAGRPPARTVLVGHDTRLVLAEAGFPPAEIESLLAAKVVAGIVLRDVPAGEPWGPPAPPAARRS
ncbi:CaiB/BaiF CoA-transferase family protein [Pseudofrankia inefficax]|uniref:L-carnitine dehydratase/bile acid-inducible protein F n=1 Tax=Pseudofrankia inefficax (strain DSM 45817 / CECT 9037 / DDB 130130 / EuI1c) TaxID=298654 RepID=E3IZI6_PSEI1|nr:CoA transferase [Pseudofrankia inefficax]ADP82756.1 L-carnitine dehydratase/bile acid-inducible protein F [Pseudofrankia inefficax]